MNEGLGRPVEVEWDGVFFDITLEQLAKEFDEGYEYFFSKYNRRQSKHYMDFKQKNHAEVKERMARNSRRENE